MKGGSEYDAVSIRKKYLEERDKRLVEGRADIRDLRGESHLARYRRDPFTPYQDRAPVTDDVDALIIGGGMAGLLAGVELRKAGLERIRIVDEAGGVGGTWYWNRYPGLMCDIESYSYLPMLEDLGYIPKNRYAFQDEILPHLQKIAAKYELTRDALFHARVERTEWDEAALRWRVRTDRGDETTAKYVIMAVGILNLMKLPAIPGMDDFQGRSFHTARWDYEYTGGNLHGGLDKLGDKTVAIIGAGGSAVQCVPHLAEAAKKLFVFQRTPSAIGVRDNRPTDEAFADDLQPGWQRDRMENLQSVMQGLPVEKDLTDDGWTRHYARLNSFPRDPSWSMQEYARRVEEFDFEVMESHRRRIDETLDDPATAEILKPYYRYACKRPLFHDEFLPSLNSPNVEVVDCPTGIERVTEKGLVVDGRAFEVDCIIYATGFEGESTPLYRRAGHDIVGRNGVALADKWSDGPRTLFGMMSRSFPNMFMMPTVFQQSVIGPNYALIAVQGAEFVGAAVAGLEEKGVAAFEVSEAAETDWCDQILATRTDGSRFFSMCTPSRINNEGRPEDQSPLASNWGGGYGDYFGFKKLLREWCESREFSGLELQK